MMASYGFNVSRLGKAGIAAVTMFGLLGASVSPAAAAICPQFIASYCVYNTAKQIFTAATNPCFAKQKHWTVIYAGKCKFR